LTRAGADIILESAPTSAATGGGTVISARREPPVIDLLVERGANAVEHPGGTLLEHLSRVASLLQGWGASEEVQAAGLCHAFYGTDGFAVTLLDLDQRDVLISRIGARAEAWVYLYASCDRAAVYPELSRSGPLRFRDRFTGETSEVPECDAAVLAELTAANELDIVTVNPAWAREIGMGLLALLRGARHRLSAAAWEAWESWEARASDLGARGHAS
jgi:hypothetical protein